MAGISYRTDSSAVCVHVCVCMHVCVHICVCMHVCVQYAWAWKESPRVLNEKWDNYWRLIGDGSWEQWRSWKKSLAALVRDHPCSQCLAQPPLPPPNEVKRGNLFPQSPGLVIHNQEPLSGWISLNSHVKFPIEVTRFNLMPALLFPTSLLRTGVGAAFAAPLLPGISTLS